MAAANASMVQVAEAAAAAVIPLKKKPTIKVTSFLKRYFPQLIVNRITSKFAKELRQRNGYHERTGKGDFKRPLPVYSESHVPLMKEVLLYLTPEVNKIAARAVRKSKRLVMNWENKVFDPNVLLQDNYKKPKDDTDSEEE
jgi:hypothetical protein